MKVNEKIRSVRESKKISRENIAEQLHMSSNGYAKIERGETKLHLDKLEQIAQILDVDICELLMLGDRDIVVNLGDYKENTNSNGGYYVNYSTSTQEIEKLNIIIQHQQELLEQKNNEIIALKEIINLLKTNEK